MMKKKIDEDIEDENEEGQEELTEAKVVSVTTQTSPAVQLEDGSIVDSLELLVRIYNNQLKIEKAVL